MSLHHIQYTIPVYFAVLLLMTVSQICIVDWIGSMATGNEVAVSDKYTHSLNEYCALACCSEYTIKVFLCRDYEFLCTMYGLSGAAGE